MKIKYFIVCLLGWALLHTACENEIELDFGANTPKLIMNSFINSDSINNYLLLSLTGPHQVEKVGDASVTVQVNGTLTETIAPESQEDNKMKEKLFRITTKFRPNDVVRIDARTNDGKHHAWAEVTVPQPASIVKVDSMTALVDYSQASMYNSYQLLLQMACYTIVIKDRPKEKNYYRLIIESNDTVCYKSAKNEYKYNIWKAFGLDGSRDVVLTDGVPPLTESSDLVTRPTNMYSIFDDHRFADSQYAMTAYTYTLVNKVYFNLDEWNNPEGEYEEYQYQWCRSDIHIRLLSITEKEYYYMKLLNVIDSGSYNEVLHEPISFPSNVHGGTGIVGISSETSVNIQKEYK